jgi:hypothetical protein
MSSNRRIARNQAGPWAWENARARLEGRPAWGALEIACYTDLSEHRLSGIAASGPYIALTPNSAYDLLSYELHGLPRMGLVLRLELHLPHDTDMYVDEQWESLNADIIPGGSGADEVAALVSLALGIRLRGGGIARSFELPGNMHGYPHEISRPPYLPQPGSGATLLPDTGGALYIGDEVDLAGVGLLDYYPYLSAEEARTLVMSARAYQEAIWIADGDPRQAWLRLVTAVEAVAQLAPSQPAQERLKVAHPDIWTRAVDTGDAELVEMLAEKLVDQSRSRAKFLKFLEFFRPPVPRRRPTYGRLDWRTLRKQLSDIYTYRSADLHGGAPFPLEMCMPRYVSPNHRAPEVSVALNGREQMSLQIFEYIVRGSLQKWCRSTSDRNRTLMAELAGKEDV